MLFLDAALRDRPADLPAALDQYGDLAFPA
jgi:hypothetical protein